ncbi:MAG: PepSY domain-containing protein [Anaerolineales bacterium]|jgi:uncharacterized membrane protein YkoI
MSQRSLILIASTLTAFLLVAVGGISASISQANAANALPTFPAATASADATAAWLAREAQYQDLIAQANAQLQQAYQKQQQLEQQLASQASPTATYAISADQAVQIAATAVPGGTVLGTPDLVSFQGTPAYEVQMNVGLVYIDANTGNVLYNSTTVQPVVIHKKASGGGDDGHEGGD